MDCLLYEPICDCAMLGNADHSHRSEANVHESILKAPELFNALNFSWCTVVIWLLCALQSPLKQIDIKFVTKLPLFGHFLGVD